MSAAAADRVIREATDELLRECALRGPAPPGALVRFMVKAVLLDPRNGFHADWALTKGNAHKLEKLCRHKLTEERTLSLDTVRMQVHFEMNYACRRELLDGLQRQTERRLRAVSREITDSRGQTPEELDALYQNIISYVLLSMGAPPDGTAERETKAALQSVLPLTALVTFMLLLKESKEQRLSELATIVPGIRLLNRASRKGGEEPTLCDLVPGVADGALPLTTEGIERELSASQRLAWKYTALLEKLTGGDSLPGERDVSVALLKQALYNVRQHEALLKRLKADAHQCGKQIERLQKEFSSQKKLLRGVMMSKSVLHTREVFPLFKVLANVWSGVLKEAEILNILNNIRLDLKPFIAHEDKISSGDSLDALLEASEVTTDEQRTTQSSDQRIVPAEMKPQEWLLPETTANLNQMPLQFNGACGYTLLKRDGLILPGNPHIGVLKQKDKFYAFTSKDAAVKFAANSNDFIAEIEEKAKLSPELIHLLNLQQQLSCVIPYSEKQAEDVVPMKPTATREGCTQTDTHPAETNIDKSYEWNEWQLRREAIKLANLRTKITHSTQTDLSHMRRENVTQTWLPKTVACQTKRDGESTMPKPQDYVTGLRAQRKGPVVKTILTRPIDE
ncbi:cilia- and flagella-associated protein 206 [Brachionichthys hirsutus]|uniref:cilia- and flagella-associated protein 206 n=1 Tax=Brachionichthys hirsutus TaxID=412623 RepID=UPI0036044679